MAFRAVAGLRVVALLSLFIPSTVNGASDFCSRDSEDDHCVPNMSFNLTRIDGKKVNHTWTVQINNYKTLTLHTRSMQPLIIEIPHFLSETESDHIVRLAEEEGFTKSKTQSTKGRVLYMFDFNNDKRISVPEMQKTIEHGFDIYFDKDDIVEMYTALEVENDDGEVSKEELEKTRPAQVVQYLEAVLAKHPEKHSRYSEQAWLFPDRHADDVFIAIQRRLSKALQLPLELIRLSDFQIVKYGVKGHYNAHFDSSRVQGQEKLSCCQRFQKTKCRLCRFLTALFYLNDVEEGGETAFPLANNVTVEETELIMRGNLYRECQGLRVSPEKGKAVVWYNHFVDPHTGWLGELDNTTFHGGCNVLQGEKWIANFWVRLSDKEADLQSMDRLRL